MVNRLKLLIALLLFPTLTIARIADTPDPTSATLKTLLESVRRGDTNAVEAFWHKIAEGGAPLIEKHGHKDSSMVTFVYRGGKDVQRVRFASGLNALLVQGIALDFDSLGQMSLVPGTDIWYLSFVIHNRLRVSYKFDVTNLAGERASVLDPYNKNIFQPELDDLRESFLEMAEASLQPWKGRQKLGSWYRGKVVDKQGRERILYVYTPAGFDKHRSEPYPVIVGLSSYGFGVAMPSAQVIDHLIVSKKIPPAVLIATNFPDGNNLEQLELTADYVANRLLPTLRTNYNLTSNPQQVIISGTSWRGLLATYVAFAKPTVVGNVLSMSGSFYWKPESNTEYEWLAHRFATESIPDLRFFISAGALETVVTRKNRGHYMVGTNRHIRDVLIARRADITYWEFEGDHNELSRQDAFARGLEVLIGKSTAKQ